MADKNQTILDFITEYNSKAITPMHMPGHKRNIAAANYLTALGGGYDYTEIDGLDDLHDADGIIKDAMDKAASLWHSKKTFFIVNGSTCGILSGIRCATSYGDSVLVARNCHKAVYHAIELCGLHPYFIAPAVDDSFEIYSSIDPVEIEKALLAHPSIRLVILTSPTYEGVISDINSISAIAHSYHIPVLVDEAHGSHLDHCDYFNGGAVNGGGDIVIQSLHKTLPSLTQTALAHINGNLISSSDFAYELGIFETSSPSYLLMSSIDGCVNLISKQGRLLFDNWKCNLQEFDNSMRKIKKLKILCHGEDSINNHTCLYKFDRSKIVISTKDTNLSGTALMHILRNNYKIELEMASNTYAIAMTGLLERTESLDILSRALLAIDQDCKAILSSAALSVPPIPPMKTTITKALSCKGSIVPANKAVGKVIGEYVWAYPPGIPLIVPGEVITADFLQCVDNYYKSGIPLKKTFSNNYNGFHVVEL